MIHYLLLPYNNFDQLELLVNKIKTKNSKIYIHVEKDVKDFPRLKNAYYIEDRQHCPWGGTGILKAELIGLKEIYKHMGKGDHAIFMSGQCFPIKPIDYIEDYIDGLGIKSSIGYYTNKDLEKRVSKYRFYDFNFHIPKFINQFLINILYSIKKFDKTIKIPVINVIISEIVSFILPQRKFILNNYQLYKGEGWFVISYEHIKFILNFLDTEKGKEFLKNYKYTLIPNETFFQTLLVNEKREEIVNECPWYVSREAGGKPSPNFLTMKDLEQIKESGKIFARKFDINKDKEILDVLNKL